MESRVSSLDSPKLESEAQEHAHGASHGICLAEVQETALRGVGDVVRSWPVSKVESIEGIEHIHAVFQVHALIEAEPLGKSEVQVIESRGAESVPASG